jgi:biuret amidohydrolase
MNHAPSALIVAAALALQVVNAQPPKTNVQMGLTGTALVVVDPQVDFLSTKGATWALVGKSVEANHTVKNLEILFTAAKANDVPIFISPHYYYPWDHRWEPSGGPGEEMLRNLKPFERKGPLTVPGFEKLWRRLDAAIQAIHQRRQHGRSRTSFTVPR